MDPVRSNNLSNIGNLDSPGIQKEEAAVEENNVDKMQRELQKIEKEEAEIKERIKGIGKWMQNLENEEKDGLSHEAVAGDGTEEVDGSDGGEEDRQPVKTKSPARLTRQEREQRELTHTP